MICASVLMGTLYPLVLDSLDIAKLSVGAPYFNWIFLPLLAITALCVGIGALTRWKRDNIRDILARVRWAAVVSLIGGLTVPFMMGKFNPLAAIGIALSMWVFLTSMQGVWERIRNRKNKITALFSTPAGFWGMTMGHIGIAVFGVGISMTSLYSIETDLRMEPGQTKELAGYQFTFDGVRQVQGPNYVAEEGVLQVRRNDAEVTTLAAQKREYDSGQMTIMTEAAIDAGITRDLYFALGESLQDSGGAWSMRIYYKPFIRWIWLGAFIMALGALLAVMDKRYRKARVKATSQVTSTTATMAAS